MSNATHRERMVHLGVKIPADLAAQIEMLSPFYKGGKSEIVRRALSEGVQSVHQSQMLTFPMQTQSVATT